jgi:hypothetical protein
MPFNTDNKLIGYLFFLPWLWGSIYLFTTGWTEVNDQHGGLLSIPYPILLGVLTTLFTFLIFTQMTRRLIYKYEEINQLIHRHRIEESRMHETLEETEMVSTRLFDVIESKCSPMNLSAEDYEELNSILKILENSSRQSKFIDSAESLIFTIKNDKVL